MKDLDSIDLRHLKAFIAVAEELNLSRAARRLNRSQPPLTRQIHQLELALGAPLFTRSARGMQLTNAGHALLADARQILQLTAQVAERVRSAALGQAGRIDIAGFGSLMLDAVPQFLARFRRAYPRVELTLQTMNRPEQVEALRQNRISAAFIRRGNEPPDITYEPFMAEKLMVALSASDALAGRKRVSLRDLASRRLVVQGSGPRPNFTDTLIAICVQAGFQPQIAQMVGDSITAVALVAAGFGVALVPHSATHLNLPGVVYVPIADVKAGIADLVCIYRKGDESPVLAAFLRELRAFRKEELPFAVNYGSPVAAAPVPARKRR
jgi:DNA-binding transcriptional LysR family regulator